MDRNQGLGRAPGKHDGKRRQDEGDKPPLVGVCAVAVHGISRLACAVSRTLSCESLKLCGWEWRGRKGILHGDWFPEVSTHLKFPDYDTVELTPPPGTWMSYP